MTTQITRPLLRALRADLDAALVSIAAKHGISLTTGHIGYTERNFTFKLEGAVVSATGEVETKEAAAFKTLAPLYGLQSDDLGRSFNWRGQKMIIIGLRPRASRAPILTRCEQNGKNYVFGEEVGKLIDRRVKLQPRSAA